VPFTRHLWNMLEQAKVITKGALLRNESRGAHYKPDFPERDDDQWLKTTIARFDGQRSPQFSYETVDHGLIPLRKRVYTST
jgi:succinate dehydrogenase / fumarate reductase flavoprotein subunit